MAKNPFILGCKPSVKTNSLTTSTGIQAVDVLLGGALPVGGLCLFEDEIGTYSQFFANCFASEGILHGHGIIASGFHGDEFFKQLPAPVSMEKDVKNFIGSSSSSRNSAESDILDKNSAIAWRYKNLPIVESAIDSKFSSGHYFNRKLPIDKKLLEKCPNVIHRQFCLSTCNYAEFIDLVKTIANEPSYSQSIVDNGVKKNLLRIVVMNIGSPLWGSCDKLGKFLLQLKSIARYHSMVVLSTLNSSLISKEILRRIRHYADAVFKIKALEGEENAGQKINKLYEGYKGLIHIEKLPSINSMNFTVPDCLDLAFKWKREQFVIERLHTPPDLNESLDSRAAAAFAPGCASNLSKSKLDF